MLRKKDRSLDRNVCLKGGNIGSDSCLSDAQNGGYGHTEHSFYKADTSARMGINADVSGKEEFFPENQLSRSGIPKGFHATDPKYNDTLVYRLIYICAKR